MRERINFRTEEVSGKEKAEKKLDKKNAKKKKKKKIQAEKGGVRKFSHIFFRKY